MRKDKRLGKFLVITMIFMMLTMSFVGMSAVAQDEDDDEEDLAGLWCLTGALCFFPIIWLIIWILIAVWVYKDAEKRGKSGILWLLVVIILGLIGLIIWLVVRPPEQPPGPAYPPQAPGYPPQQPGYPPQQPPPGYPPQQPPQQPGY
ncbi:MAG: hypothetical protein JSV56_13070 [Methanomassiliicoccales archaeon]|nr:MAG: hypothetical protein JSV56_13070 [Methanomassiliicoccales archaeon]